MEPRLASLFEKHEVPQRISREVQRQGWKNLLLFSKVFHSEDAVRETAAKRFKYEKNPSRDLLDAKIMLVWEDCKICAASEKDADTSQAAPVKASQDSYDVAVPLSRKKPAAACLSSGSVKKRPSAVENASMLEPDKKRSANRQNLLPGEVQHARNCQVAVPTTIASSSSGASAVDDAAAKLKDCIHDILEGRRNNSYRDELVDNVMAKFANDVKNGREVMMHLVNSIDLPVEKAAKQLALVCSRLSTSILCSSASESGVFDLLDDVWGELDAHFAGMSPSRETLQVVAETQENFFQTFLLHFHRCSVESLDMRTHFHQCSGRNMLVEKHAGIDHVRTKLAKLAEFKDVHLTSDLDDCSDAGSNAEGGFDSLVACEALQDI